MTSAEAAPRDAVAVDPVEVHDVVRRFDATTALDGVSLRLASGSIHALLGPNGAGKTTLLRIMTGQVAPDRGEVRLLGVPWSRATSRRLRQTFGFVPSGDRSFYLRLTAVENLTFFGRLYGLRRSAALQRTREVLEAVELSHAADRPVGVFSHGMQKRLSLARALLLDPPILFVDEATHDLDPQASARARDLVASAARDGAAVIWATQRVDEIRGFADRVTLLDRGVVRFAGTVPELMGTSGMQRFLLHVSVGPGSSEPTIARLSALLDDVIVLPAGGSGEEEHVVVALPPDGVLGDVIAKIAGAGIRVLACREERSEIEQAFLRLTAEPT
ncbi:MAG TPA: ABC transporter ATP-binding protein [Actinomycetota bacterium]|nr:ABC transporter ATP-binding protein [Actinomycetota bacterium]